MGARTLPSSKPRRGWEMPITVQWSHIGLGSVIAFLLGWFIFGLLGAIVLAVIVLVLMGVIRIDRPEKKSEVN